MFVTVFTIFGLSGLLLQALAGSIFCGTLPRIIEAYQQASDIERSAMEVVFKSEVDAAFIGILNLSNFLLGMWIIGIGAVLTAERRSLGTFALVLGSGVFGFGLTDSLQLSTFEALELFAFLLPLWILWLGVVILRNNGPVALSESN